MFSEASGSNWFHKMNKELNEIINSIFLNIISNIWFKY